MVGGHEHAVAGDGGTAIRAAPGFALNAVRVRFVVRPELPAGGRVDGEDLIPSGDVHDAVRDDGCGLETG